MNRSSRYEWVRVRQLLEDWYASYPHADAPELRERFRDGEAHQHFASWWELYLFTLFSRLGYEVEIHPLLAHTSKRPDFLLSREDQSMYVEARLVQSGIVEEDGEHGPLESQIIDLINKGRHPSFSVGVSFQRFGTQMPRAREVLGPLLAWLDSLDPDKEEARLADGAGVQNRVLHVRDWTIEFDAFPVSREHRGERTALIGVYPAMVGSVDDTERVREALYRKGSRYNDLGAPYVVALLAMSSFMDDSSIEKALFGDMAWTYRVNDPAYEQHWVRQRNGYWIRPDGVGGRRVSGVLVGKSLVPWSVARLLPELWLNPFAAHPLGVDLGLRTCHPTEAAAFTYQDATLDPARTFGLPADWPGFN